MDKGNADKHRRSLSGLKVTETSKWGADTARSRYGSLKQNSLKAKDETKPQDPVDKQGAGYSNDTKR